MEHKPYGPYETYFKRPLDILCALAALIVFGWLYILVAVLVRIKLGSPVIFKQPRPGRDEKIFDLYKFRSMTKTASFCRTRCGSRNSEKSFARPVWTSFPKRSIF